MSVAYLLGSSTVLRAGTGIFHQRVDLSTVREVARFDPPQTLLLISNPSYPDPFQSGFPREFPASSRVRADDLAAPYTWNGELFLLTSPFIDPLVGS